MENYNKEDIATLETFNDTTAATLAMDQLQEKGIDAFIEDENPTGLDPLGGVEVKVFAKDLLKAKEILTHINDQSL